MAALDGAPLNVWEELNQGLVEAGYELLQHPPSSKEEILEKLENLEHLLLKVAQVPAASALDAIRPAMEALVADVLLRHPDIDVKVSVASCISEIMRITAPEQPYGDSKIKDFFELAVLAFGKLSCLDGHCYSKAVSIIGGLAKYRTCVLMWDLELDALVVQMFQHFLNTIRPDHPDHVFMNIKEIMSMMIKESIEGIPMQLLNILISSVNKENQNVSSRSYLLGERVLQESAVKLHPYLPAVLRSLGISTNNYSEVLELILREEESDQFVNGASKSQVENGPEELCQKAACFDDVRPPTEETSMLPDTGFKVAASNGTVVISMRPVDVSFKTLVNNDSEKLSPNASYGGKVCPPLSGSSKSPTNDDPRELAPHAAPERGALILDQRSHLPGKESEHINAAKKELNPEAAQASKKRGWKPNFFNKPEEGYEHAWLSGERRSKGRIRLKGSWKNTKKRSSCSPKCAISKGLYSSSGEEKTPIMTSIKRRQKKKNDRIGQNDGAQEEDSADKVVSKHGKELVGCRVRVWWPLDQAFYGGHITLFDHSEKKHMAIYEDGDQEMLNLTNERWELVEDDNASVPSHKIVPCPSDLSDRRLGCIVDSYRQLRKKKKALNVDDNVPVLTPGSESKKIIFSKAKSYWDKATDDPTPPSTMTMQQNLTPKGVHQNKRIKVAVSESGVEGNPMSWTTPTKVSPEDGDVCSELVDVHGYKVKVSNAPILSAIFAEYGDITVNCHYKSPTVRASFLDVVSDVVRRLKTSDINSSSIKAMKSVVSDALDAKLDVTWLQKYLDEITKEEDMEEKFSYLIALHETTMLVSKAAKKDVVERNMEVLAAEKRLKKAEKCLQEAQSRAGEAKRSVKVFDVLGKKVKQDINGVKDQAQYWLSRLNELL